MIKIAAVQALNGIYNKCLPVCLKTETAVIDLGVARRGDL